MPIPGRALGRISHPRSAKASKQAHLSIRKALAVYQWPDGFVYDVLLQGSYKNATNLSGDSDVDVVIRLNSSIGAHVAALTGQALQAKPAHQHALARWQSFREHALAAMRAKYGSSVEAGRKTIKIPKGELHAPADLVVTLRCGDGIAFYLTDERRWVVSYPEQHHQLGFEKEGRTNNKYKSATRTFKDLRNELIRKRMISKTLAPSYFIECLLYNVPDEFFRKTLAWRFQHILDYLKSKRLKGFKCQNGRTPLFGNGKEQWDAADARAFLAALQRLWDEWPA